jgi:hypothetical protein
VESDFISNEELDAVNVPYRDPDLLRAAKHFMAPVIQSLQIGRKMRFVRSVADDILFEVGAYLGNKVATVAITLHEIVHLGFEYLFYVGLFDIIGSDVETDANGSDNYDAEYCESQCNTQA